MTALPLVLATMCQQAGPSSMARSAMTVVLTVLTRSAYLSMYRSERLNVAVTSS